MVSDGDGVPGLRGIRASPCTRRALLEEQAGHTSLTRGFTGRLARGIHNRLLEQLDQSGAEVLPYPLQRALVRMSQRRPRPPAERIVAAVGGTERATLPLYGRRALLSSLISKSRKSVSSYRRKSTYLVARHSPLRLDHSHPPVPGKASPEASARPRSLPWLRPPTNRHPGDVVGRSREEPHPLTPSPMLRFAPAIGSNPPPHGHRAKRARAPSTR